MQKKLSFNGDAFAVFSAMADRPGAFFLDSSLLSKDGAVSIMGFAPSRIIKGEDLDRMRRVFSLNHRLKALAVGFITYEGGFHFGIYRHWITIDHAKRCMTIHASTPKMLAALCALAQAYTRRDHAAVRQAFIPKSNFSRSAYMRSVRKALESIKRGDIYQINLSRVISAKIRVDPLRLYGALRKHSPSPFAAYYDAGREKILSSSPERFLRLTGRQVQVRPMKGTRPRGRTLSEDKRMRRDLEQSPKEIAELLMVTDLERNDLGRVCKTGSVKVAAMRTIEAYASVYQATAAIEGVLASGKGAFDLIKAAFPSGSVTGCPKIEAMKIIKKIEGVPRGFYTGALGYIDPKGNMDLSVLIRSVSVSPGGLRYHVGGGIVADSDPKREYEETVLKAKAIESAIREVSHA